MTMSTRRSSSSIFQSIDYDRLSDKELLGIFVQSLVLSLRTSGLYDPKHPSAQGAMQDMFDVFARAMSGHNEVSLVCVQVASSKFDVLIEGYFDEPLPLSDCMPASTASLYVGKLIDYFDQHRMFSLSLDARLTREEMQRFVEAMLECLHPGVSPDDLRAIFMQRGIDHIGVLFRDDAVGSVRRLTWRAELWLSRLTKDLTRIPLLARASRADLEKAYGQVLEDLFRTVRHADMVAEVLVNLDLAAPTMMDHGIAEPLQLVVHNAQPHMRPELIQALRVLRDRITREGGVRPRERPDLLQAAQEATQVVAREMVRDIRREHFQCLADLVRDRVLHLADLPKDLATRVEARRIAGSMWQRRERTATFFANAVDISGHVAPLPFVAPELVQLGGTPLLVDIIEALQQRLERPHGAAEEALIERVLETLLPPHTIQALVDAYTELNREERLRLVVAVGVFGQAGAGALVRLLALEDARIVVDAILTALRATGATVEESLVGVLTQPNASAATLRNALLMIEELGCTHAHEGAATLLEHGDAEVRAAAIPYAARCLGKTVEAALIRLLTADPVARVREQALEHLGRMRSRHPVLLSVLAAAIDPGRQQHTPEPLRRVAVVVLGQLGDGDLGPGPRASIRLAQALSRGQTTVLGIVVGQRPEFSPITRGLICDTLARMGGEQALAALAKVAADEADPVADRAREALEVLKGSQQRSST